VPPDSLLEMVAANGAVVADRGAAKAVSVRPGAAIMAILALAAVTTLYRRRLAVVGVPAAMADRQPLQKPARATQASNSNWPDRCADIIVRFEPRHGAAVLNRSGSA